VKELFFKKYWIFLNFLRLGDPKLRDFGQFVILQINYDVIKLQEYQL